MISLCGPNGYSQRNPETRAKAHLRNKEAARPDDRGFGRRLQRTRSIRCSAVFEGDHRAFVHWWRSRVNGAMQNRIQFPTDIASVRGSQALLDRPQVIVGTIHSVKGGEADVVVLFRT